MRLPNASRGFLETAQPAGAPGRAGARTEAGGVLFPDNEGGPLADASLTPARPGVCLLIDCRGVSTACLLIDRATGGPRGFRRTFGQ